MKATYATEAAQKRMCFDLIASTLIVALPLTFHPDIDQLYQTACENEVSPHQYTKFLHTALTQKGKKKKGFILRLFAKKPKEEKVASKKKRRETKSAGDAPPATEAEPEPEEQIEEEEGLKIVPCEGLPPDWICVKNDMGDIFYYNQETTESAWSFPTE